MIRFFTARELNAWTNNKNKSRTWKCEQMAEVQKIISLNYSKTQHMLFTKQ